MRKYSIAKMMIEIAIELVKEFKNLYRFEKKYCGLLTKQQYIFDLLIMNNIIFKSHE